MIDTAKCKTTRRIYSIGTDSPLRKAIVRAIRIATAGRKLSRRAHFLSINNPIPVTVKYAAIQPRKLQSGP
jgi:hypothetical protein